MGFPNTTTSRFTCVVDPDQSVGFGRVSYEKVAGSSLSEGIHHLLLRRPR